ncbi:MAG: sulfite dehydrogenase [Acidobacteria bacterium]|nr:sulfite dehydrogenase [Acidobacteriota bacterium]
MSDKKHLAIWRSGDWAIGRRRFLGLGSLGALASTVAAACRKATPPAKAVQSWLGAPVSRYGARAKYETAAREFRQSRRNEASSSRTPLQSSHGVITPSSLHFERHHGGVPDIDPATHRLLIHGLVDRPVILTMDEIRRLPSVSRIYFLECSGNTGSEWGGPNEPDVQRAFGLTSCSEWTGVPLRSILDDLGLQSAGRWIVAEGADACRMTRSLPIEKAMDDVLLAYGQNGEALRPEQGYPLRLFVPGWEGNINVKWLRVLKVVAEPAMSREETSKYTDLMPDGRARQFSFTMDAKSVITHPSGGHKLASPGVCEITGLAWSGRGAIARVEVSTDNGATWHTATLDTPVLKLAHTRFHYTWWWDGQPAVIRSRCIDETGYVQPTREELVAVRGFFSNYHYNGIQSWKVQPDGTVTNA